MTTMAHFSGTCPDCGERWQPGDLIRAQAIPPGESPIWKHATCPAPTLDLDRLGPTDSELESPTPLAEQIAREHLAILNTSTWLIVGCTCDPALTAPPSGAAGSWYAAHIATVTEQAVRERVAKEIERLSDALTDDPDRAALELLIEDAARIARGDTR